MEKVFCEVLEEEIDRNRCEYDLDCENCHGLPDRKRKKLRLIKALEERVGVIDRCFEDVFYIKHPQREHLKEVRNKLMPTEKLTWINEENLDAETYVALQRARLSYFQTGSPIFALKAFNILHRAGYYPPLWALNCICEIFQRIDDSEGGESLDRLFELTRGKGQSPIHKEIAEIKRDKEIFFEIIHLFVIFGTSVNEACDMVARKWEAYYNDFPGQLGIQNLSAATIKDRYKRQINRYIAKHLRGIHWNDYSDEEKREMLNEYPQDSIPSWLAKKL